MTRDRLDGEIDRAVIALMAAEPSPGLRSRVMARLEEPAAPPFRFASPLTAAVATLLLAAAVGFALWPREPQGAATVAQNPAPPATSMTETPPHAGTPAATRHEAPVAVPALRPHAARRPAAPERAGDRQIRAATAAPAEDRIVIAALRPLDEIAFAPVAPADIPMREIVIDPIQIEALRVDPLSPGSR